MITNEQEIRIALEAMLACTLASYGLWGCALVVVLLMLPWRPLLAVGTYLVQPIVDWRIRKARARREKGMAQFVRELHALLPEPGESRVAAVQGAFVRVGMPRELPAAPAIVEAFGATACDARAAWAISSALQVYFQSHPQGSLSGMDLNVEAIELHGDTAEALVKFQSANVSALVIRRRYFLRQSNGQWQVRSRELASGVDHPPQPPAASPAASLRC